MPVKELEDGFEVDIKPEDKGKNEGPPEGSPRWNEIYYKAKEGERAIKELESLKSENAATKELIDAMKQHNAELVEALKGDTEGKRAEDALAKAETELASLRQARKEAIEKSDFDKIDDLEDKIFDAKLKIKDMKAPKPPKSEEKKVKSDDKPDSMTSEDEKVYSDWMDNPENKWFHTNPRMRSAAIAFEKELNADPEWSAATIEEVLAEVSARTLKKYGPPDTDGIDLVAGHRKGLGDGGNKVKITAIDAELAKGFGVSVEDMAKQKAVIAARPRRSGKWQA